MEQDSTGQSGGRDQQTLLYAIGGTHFLLPIAIYFMLASAMQRPFEQWHPLVALPALAAFFYNGPKTPAPGTNPALTKMLVRMSFGDFAIILAIVLAGSTLGHVFGFVAGYAAMAYAFVHALRETREQEPPPAPTS